MAALVAGVQYGLSSHSNFYENKSLIFVKLTDSAQRAIEDYLKNRNKTSLSPTIQFLGNEGQLSFPSSQPSHVSTGFTFSLSSNHDIEGPQGAFECIQQTGPKSLESLGTLPCKMRIQANDDVYETTRHRMAVAEENSKIKCTRVIKANGPDIGRKVKVKATGKAIPPTTTSSSSYSSSSSSSSSSTSSSSLPMSFSSTASTTTSSTAITTSTTTATSTTNVRHRESLSIPTTISQSSRNNSHLYSSTTTSSSATVTPLLSSSSSNLLFKSIGTNSNSSIRTQQDKKLPELMRRPLKERLIHVLALRPYKKPELYDRITREGIKERDRSTMTTILKQVAFMRDNTYHLHRHVWNDVQEDWPFYNEQDRAMLKRRKPQNLTPPGSSDGSSGSGQSPNSTHPGSPPAISAPPASLLNSKRPGYYQGNDGLQTKRPRISHYRKPEPTVKTSVTHGNNSNNNGISNTNSGHGSNGNSNISDTNMINSMEVTNWDHQQQNRHQQRDRMDHRTDRTERNERVEKNERTTHSDVLHSSHTTVTKSHLSPSSNSDENVSNNTNNNKNNGVRHGKTSSSSSSSSSGSTAAAAMTAHNNATSTHSHNNMQSIMMTSRHSNNNINGNDKVSSIGYSGNSIGAGINDYAGSVGGSKNNNDDNNNKNNFSNTGGGCKSRSNTFNNGGNNESYGTSLCNSEHVEIKRVVNDSRDERHAKDGRNNDRERGCDKEQRGLLKENIGSAISENNSHKHNHDSTMSFCASNNYISSSGNDAAITNTTTMTTAAAVITAATTTSSSTVTFTTASPTVINNNAKTSEYPDYLTQYTAINNTEQRRRYKAEFNSDYEEYRRLHTQVAKVSRRFAQLEERRQRELENGNITKCEELREQIVSEYISTKNDPSHIETKRRFHYLHEKLSHIKRLVLEYDTQHFGVTTSGGLSNNCDDILNGGGDFRY